MSYILGLTGGIATGKSHLSGVLREAGAWVIDADQISHEITAENGPAIPLICEAFGPEYDLSFQVKARYEECESEWALTADSVDFVRVHNVAVAERPSVARIYPNPAHQVLNIETTLPHEAILYDLLGQQVLASKDNKLEINGLNKGVYFVKVTTEKGSVVQKIVIE